jgi:hypothetical protein
VKIKYIVSILVITCTLPTVAVGAGSKPHDHQATKTHIHSTSSTKDSKTDGCATGGKETKSMAEKAEGESAEAVKKCEKIMDGDKQHDHRKMKNL